MLVHALNLLRRGFSVIPVATSRKQPLIQWQEFQKRRASEDEVKSWWAKTPNANIGIVTGQISGLCVLDVDGEKGSAWLQNHPEIHSSTTVLTGKGKHLYFKWSDGIRNSASKIAAGIDIRGEGGFVLSVPSVHPNGKRYRLLTNVRLDAAQLPNFPTDLLTQLPTQVVSEQKPEGWIAEALKGMKNGNIDSTLFTICSRLRADGYSAADALALLSPHARSAGATPGHLEEKIDNVWSRYKPNARASIQLETVTGDQTEDKEESLESFLETDEQVSWIIPGIIAKGSIAFLVGLPETGKTWAAIDLAIEASRNGKWLSCFNAAKARTLFIDQERFKGETKRRFRAVLSGKGITPKDVGDLEVKSGSTYKLDLDQSYTAFRKKLERTRPDLVIVDSFAAFHTKEENSRKDIQEVLERIKALRNEFGCTFLFIHHENKLSYQSKEEGKEPSLAEMAGNIAIPAAAETVLTVRKRIDGTSIIYQIKSTLSRTHAPFEMRVTDLDGPNKIEVKGYL